jgi:hypothetical protein
MKAHYIAVIKTNQPTAYSQLAALSWRDIPVQHTASASEHGRRGSRSSNLLFGMISEPRANSTPEYAQALKPLVDHANQLTIHLSRSTNTGSAVTGPPKSAERQRSTATAQT